VIQNDVGVLEDHDVTPTSRHGHVENGTREVILGPDVNDLRWIPAHDFQSTVCRAGVHDQEIESDVLLGEERSEGWPNDGFAVFRAH
jgi:hypothetical protein